MSGVPELASAAQGTVGPPWWVTPLVTAVLTTLGTIAGTLATIRVSARRAVELEVRKQQLDVEKQQRDVSFRRQVEWCEAAISDATALLEAATSFQEAAIALPGAREHFDALIAHADRLDVAVRAFRARSGTALIYVPAETYARLNIAISVALNSPELKGVGDIPGVVGHFEEVRRKTAQAIVHLVFHVRTLLGQPPLDAAGIQAIQSLAPALPTSSSPPHAPRPEG